MGVSALVFALPKGCVDGREIQGKSSTAACLAIPFYSRFTGKF
jgi:hypothetical protein